MLFCTIISIILLHVILQHMRASRLWIRARVAVRNDVFLFLGQISHNLLFSSLIFRWTIKLNTDTLTLYIGVYCIHMRCASKKLLCSEHGALLKAGVQRFQKNANTKNRMRLINNREASNGWLLSLGYLFVN